MICEMVCYHGIDRQQARSYRPAMIKNMPAKTFISTYILGLSQLHYLVEAFPAIILPNWISFLIANMTISGNENSYCISTYRTISAYKCPLLRTDGPDAGILAAFAFERYRIVAGSLQSIRKRQLTRMPRKRSRPWAWKFE